MNLQMAQHVDAAFGGFDTHLQIVLLILILSGILGGIGNYFLRDRDVDRPNDWLRYPVLGVVAALTAPLILSMLSSNLIEAGRTRATDYLVLVGFVLFYVVFSRRLFDNALQRLVGQADKLQKDLGRLRAGIEQIQNQPARSNAAPRANPAAPSVEVGEPTLIDAEAPAAQRDGLTHADVELLRAVADENIVYGNLADLADRSGVTRELAQQRLAVLKSWGALDTRMNDKQVLQWIVSAKGKQMLADRLR